MKLLVALFGVALLLLLGCAGQKEGVGSKQPTADSAKSIKISDSDLTVKDGATENNLDQLTVPDLSSETTGTDKIQDSDLMVEPTANETSLDDLTTPAQPI